MEFEFFLKINKSKVQEGIRKKASLSFLTRKILKYGDVLLDPDDIKW